MHARRFALAGLSALVFAGCAADSAEEATEADDSALDATTAKALVAKTATCKKVSKAPYARDEGRTANIDVCGLDGAVFFKADMDIDCDGKTSAVCNRRTDPSYQNQTAATDSKGNALDAATLPYIVLPIPTSARWDYRASGIKLGSVAAVVYKDKVVYGIVGDIGPTTILGEASYALAKSLGINADPARGGVDSGVTYVVFTGASGVVKKKEDHAEAVRIGKARAAQLTATK